MKDKMIKLICVFWVLAAMSPLAMAYPPDNAAVLYYKAFLKYNMDESIECLKKLENGETGLNDEIRELIQKNRVIIDCMLEGSKIKNCDWGLDLSRGLDLELPHVSKLRRMVYLISTDAKILIVQGDYEAAIDRYMGIYKIARHVNDNITICNLVGVSFNGIANGGLVNVLSNMPVDSKMLEMLKNKLQEIDSIPFSIKQALASEKEVFSASFTLAKVDSLVRNLAADNEDLKKIILGADESFMTKNKVYWNEMMDKIQDAFELSDVEGFEMLGELAKQASSDEAKKSTPLASECLPSWSKIYSLNIRWQSGFNAVKAGVEVYMIRAETGKLPDVLPAGLPVDMFSGKAFEYRKTEDGFVLKCPGKDLSKDEAYEYKFKVQ